MVADRGQWGWSNVAWLRLAVCARARRLFAIVRWLRTQRATSWCARARASELRAAAALLVSLRARAFTLA